MLLCAEEIARVLPNALDGAGHRCACQPARPVDCCFAKRWLNAARVCFKVRLR